MDSKCVMMLGDKESFFIKVLIKKMKQSGIEAMYVHADTQSIEAALDKCGIASYYMENGEIIKDEVLDCLNDRLAKSGKQLILIGEPSETGAVLEKISKELVYKTFERPLNNDSFIGAVNTYFSSDSFVKARKRILIIDDDIGYMSLVRQWLRDNYKVFMASTAEQAFKLIELNGADLILLDYEMPYISGPQLFEMLSKKENSSDIPVIFLTGRDDGECMETLASLDHKGFFLKTIKGDELNSSLAQFFMENNK